MTHDKTIGDLDARLGAVLASGNVLFRDRLEHDAAIQSAGWPVALRALLAALEAARGELGQLTAHPEAARRLFETAGAEPDSIDHANLVALRGAAEGGLRRVVEPAVWDAIRACLPADAHEAPADLNHVLRHGARFAGEAGVVWHDYVRLLESIAAEQGYTGLSRVGPAMNEPAPEANPFAGYADGVDAAGVAELRAAVRAHDLFSEARTFRAVGEGVLGGPIGAIRALDNFYGYQQERDQFHAHFGAFVRGEPVPPLLVTGMPGMGKTHLTIASALALEDPVLITAEARHLGDPLEHLLDLLRSHPYRTFVLFFDDLDPELVDWSTFRNHVDGYLPQAENVAIVLATNGEFSARVRSRGKTLAFRPMNPEVCQEFITDYLEEHRWMSQPYPNLVSTLAADYASMYKRGVLNELSPRSLIRYFEMLENDKEKIRRLIRESLDDIVRVPSEEPFLQSNQQIMERLRRERGGALGLAPSEPEPALKPYFGEKSRDSGDGERGGGME